MPLSYPNRQQILINGWPRSGNSWTAQLIGSILNAPVTGAYNAVPLSQEGLERDSPYVVRQLHIKPTYNQESTVALESGWSFSIPLWTNERLIHIVRDPRDVCVSAHFYWKRESLTETINAIANGLHPFIGVGSWPNYEQQWTDVENNLPDGDTRYTTLHYEDLLEYPYEVLGGALDDLGHLPYTHDAIANALNEQSFAHKKEQISRDGDSRPYGKEIQLTHLRKGISGDWRNEFTFSQRELAHSLFQPWLEYYSYERNSDWLNA